ncbi:response regulator, partial [Acinetobacter baumannii]
SIARPPDLILSDLRLPGSLNGIDVITKLRETLGQSLPAIILPGDTGADVLSRIRQAELSLLHKPYTAEALRRAIIEQAAR